MGSRDAVLDGEVVAFDEHSRPSFQLLQRRMHVDNASGIRRLAQEVPVVYVLFDLLWLDGRSVTDEPYLERRARLAELGLQGAAWQTPPHEVGDGAATLDVSRRFGIEGAVAKRADSRYEPGRRSPAWQKVKNTLRQEFVVGGWLEGEGGRANTVGSLLIGYYEGTDDERVLQYAGRVGSGLTQRDLRELQRLFERCPRDTAPFAAGSLPRGAHWVEPCLVVEVKFTEWTASGIIRQPTFLGYRTDKDPEEVGREVPVSGS
jgi:bifunctional non-homologous end joining protein LigD